MIPSSHKTHLIAKGCVFGRAPAWGREGVHRRVVYGDDGDSVATNLGAHEWRHC